MLTFLLLLLGAICFGLAALQIGSRRADLLPIGLLFWILVPLIEASKHVNF